MEGNLSLLPLVQAVENVTGQRVHLSTILRWSQQGRRGHRLQTWVLGSRRLTTEEAVRSFVAATTEASEPASQPAMPAKSGLRGRQRDISAAKSRLERAGI